MWADVPVTPDAEEARRWAEQELARNVYHEQVSWWEAFLRRLYDLFISPFKIDAPDVSSLSGLVIMAVLLTAVIVLILFASRLRRNRKASGQKKPSATLFTDDADSTELFARAAKAAANGNITAAFLHHFRAVIRTADERALIYDRVGLTAQEAAKLVGKLPASEPIGRFADMFDAASYGDEPITTNQLQQLINWSEDTLKTWRKLAPLVDVGERG